jgi:hypothetical protein
MSLGACRALVATLLTLVVAIGFAVPVSAQQENLRTTALTTYDIRPGSGLIRATIVLTFENRRDSVLRGETWGPVYIEDAAGQLNFSRRASRAGNSRDLPGPWKAMRINLPDIPANGRVIVAITYDLEQPETLVDTFPARIGAGYVFACLTGQRTLQGTLRVDLPGGFETTISGSEMEETASGLTTGQVANPESLFTCVEGTNASRLVETRFVGPAGRQITLQAYPENTDWLVVAELNTSDALDRVHAFLGLNIPGDRQVLVRQTPPAVLGGYASDHGTPGVVQVDERAGTPPADIDHEAAHAWFTTDNYPERWMREGLASWTSTSIDGAACSPVGPGSTVMDLSEWQVIRPTAPSDIEDIIRAQEDAACGIISAVAAQMDDDTFKAVIASMLNGDAKYVGSGIPGSALTSIVDFREWLDAVDELGLVPSRVENLDFAQDLILQYGISKDFSLLEERSATRQRYHDFLDKAAPMTAPDIVRQAMDDWFFPEANQYLDQAEAILSAMTSADQLLPSAAMLTIIQDDFEAASSTADLEAVLRTASSLLDEAQEIVGPLNELDALSPTSWTRPPDAVRRAITDQRFDDVLRAIVPALAIVRDAVAADAALPQARLLDDLQTRYETGATVSELAKLAEEIATTRRQAEATSIEFATLQGLVGEWLIPAAVTDPIEAGQLESALVISQDARGVIVAARAADTSLPEAGIAASIRPSFEAVGTGAEMAALRADAEKLSGQAVAVGDALLSLRGTIGDWKWPAIVRDPIDEGDFPTAAATAAAAQRWIEFAALADESLPEIEALTSIREDFETASSLAELEAGGELAFRWSQAATRVRVAIDVVAEPRDLLTQFGLIGTDVTPQLESAIAFVKSGNVALATSEAVSVIDIIRSGSSNGGLRLIGIVFLGIAILGVLGLFLIFRRDAGPPWAKHGKPPWAK